MMHAARDPIRIAIVDDHKILRASLIQYIALHPDLRFVGEGEDGNAALKLVQHHRIDVLLLDLRMPRFTGIEAIARLRILSPRTRILVFSGLPEEQYAISLIRKGATGFLSKECALAEIAPAIRTVALGHTYLSPAASQLLAQEVISGALAAPHERLAAREFQTFIRLARGFSTSDIAVELSLSSKTITTYRRRALEKLNLHSNSELTLYALKHQLVE